MVYYFAYGSNLDYVRMFHRCESAEVVCRATLDGYRLVFMENNSKRINKPSLVIFMLPCLFRHFDELVYRSEVEVHVAVGVAGCGDDVATVHHEVRMRVRMQT